MCCGGNNLCTSSGICCPRDQICGNICCPPGEQCLNGSCQAMACGPGTVPCTSLKYKKELVIVPGKPHSPRSYQVTTCCPPNVTCCGGTCCGSNQSKTCVFSHGTEICSDTSPIH
jgi:hypothetical protein